MKLTFTTLLLFLSFFIKSQVSITTIDMPQAGDTFLYSLGILDTSVLLGYQKTGPNQQWSFDSIRAQRQNVERYFASSNTPYAGQVNNRIGLKVADTLALGIISLYDVYDFYQNNNAEFVKDYRAASVPTGLSWPFPAVLAIAPAFTDKDEIYQFPLNYLDRDSTSFNFAYSNTILGAYYGSSGYRINEVEAWGTIHTPYGTFSAIKVVSNIVSYDTVSFGGTNFGLHSHTREYKWLSNQIQFPVLTVNGNVFAGTFVPSNVQYIDSIRNVPSLFAPLALFSADSTSARINDTISFSNNSLSVSPIQSNWSISPSTFQYVSGTSSTTQDPIVVFTDTGFYNVQLIVQNNQGIDTLLRSDYIRISPTVTTLSENFQHKSSSIIFPNPIKKGNPLWLKLDKEVKPNRIIIYDVEGNELMNKLIKMNTNTLLLPTQSLLNGSYFVVLFNNEKQIANHKFIVH